MKTEEIKRWEIIESRGRRYLRDRHKNQGILIEIHESQVVTEDVYFITIIALSLILTSGCIAVVLFMIQI